MGALLILLGFAAASTSQWMERSSAIFLHGNYRRERCQQEWKEVERNGWVDTTREERDEPSVFNARLFIVISHCRESTARVHQFLKSSSFPFAGVHIVSKCGRSPDWTHWNQSELQLMTHSVWDNIGRCDHTYARWILENRNLLTDSDVVIFTKDTFHIGEVPLALLTIDEMIRNTKRDGYSCGTRVMCPPSTNFHDTATLGRFMINQYFGARTRGDRTAQIFPDTNTNNRTTLAQWWAMLPNSLVLPPVVPVCYGGYFAARGRNLKAVPGVVWKGLVESLSVGDNIREGHFAERTWGALISNASNVSIPRGLRICNPRFMNACLQGIMVPPRPQRRKRR